MGPERIETLWWRGPSVRRDYYRVATESGRHLWMFRRLRTEMVRAWRVRLTREFRSDRDKMNSLNLFLILNPLMMRYAELHCKTNFSFLEGASHPGELVQQAAELEYRALAVTDRNSLAGVVRAHMAAKEVGLPLVIGAEITPTRCAAGGALGDRSGQLRAVVPADYARTAAGAEGGVCADAGRCSGVCAKD